jgi:hypothetical protein
MIIIKILLHYLIKEKENVYFNRMNLFKINFQNDLMVTMLIFSLFLF